MPHSLASHLKHPAKECLACFKRLEPVSSCSNIHRSDFQIAFFAFGQQWLFSGKAGETAFQRFLRSHLCCMSGSLASHPKHLAKERAACSRTLNRQTIAATLAEAAFSRRSFLPCCKRLLFGRKPAKRFSGFSVATCVACPIPWQENLSSVPKECPGMLTLSEAPFSWRSFPPCRKRPLSGRKPTKRLGGSLRGACAAENITTLLPA